MILNDHQISRLCYGPHAMITPFVSESIREVRTPAFSETSAIKDCEQSRKVISFGVSSSGYDIRLAPEFKVFTNTNCVIVDPKNFSEKSFVEFKGDECIIPPNSFILGRSIERFRIPDNIISIVLGKSTYARCGLIVNVTPMENGWEGYLTIEISNTTPLPVKVYANEGIAQCLFFQTSFPPKHTYKDRPSGVGKYDNQGPEIVLPRL